MSFGMGRHENLWDYSFHKFILCVCVGRDMIKRIKNQEDK